MTEEETSICQLKTKLRVWVQATQGHTESSGPRLGMEKTDFQEGLSSFRSKTTIRNLTMSEKSPLPWLGLGPDSSWPPKRSSCHFWLPDFNCNSATHLLPIMMSTSKYPRGLHSSVATQKALSIKRILDKLLAMNKTFLNFGWFWTGSPAVIPGNGTFRYLRVTEEEKNHFFTLLPSSSIYWDPLICQVPWRTPVYKTAQFSGHLGDSVVERLPLAQVMIPGSWDWVLCQPPRRELASPSAYISHEWINVIFKTINNALFFKNKK